MRVVVLPWTYALLEPGDTLELGMRVVKVLSVEEGNDGYLRVSVVDA